MANSAFEPALSNQMTWAINPNRFNEDGNKPYQLSFFIPADSILEFANHLTQLATQADKVKTGKIWDFEARKQVEVPGFYLNGKGAGEEGTWAAGAMNLQQVPGHPSSKIEKAPVVCGLTPPANSSINYDEEL